MAGVVGGCGLAEPPPFAPERIVAMQKEMAKEAPSPVLRPLPTTLQSVMPPGVLAPTTLPARTAPQEIGPTVAMTLQEMIHRVAANNLDARVAGYEASVDEARITEAKSRFDPVFFTNGQFQKQFQQTTIGGNLTPPEVLSQQLQTGIRQNLPDGGQIELSQQLQRQEVTPTTPGTISPFYQSQLQMQLTQPLLRDFGGEVNRARITIARNDMRISQLDWRDKLETALANAEEGYWRLYQAQQNVKIQEELLARTEDTLDILIKRLKQDTSRVQVSQGYASVQSRRAELVRLKAQLGDLSDQLKRIMNDPDLPVVSPQTILPADRPIEEAIHFSLEDQIAAALENRFDILEQKYRIASAGTVRKAARNNTLPQLNLQATLGLQGLGDDADSALDEERRSSLFFYTVGMSFEVPFGNRGPQAIYLRTLLQQEQAMVQYRLIVDQAALEVKRQFRELETTWNEMIATKHARFAAADALLAIEQRERAGEPMTPTFVQLKLDRQDALAQAARNEVQATANYNIAISALEKAKGTLLRYDNIAMKEEPGSPMAKTPIKEKKKK